MRKYLKAFTIPELLIALFVLGVVVAVFTYFIGVQRATTRDAKRISDISVMRASFGQYWLQKATYPASEGVWLGQAGSERLGGNGITSIDDPTAPVYLGQFPVGPNSGEYYAYRGNEKGYSLMFTTERETAYGAAGTYYAHAGGVDNLDEVK